MVKTSKKLLAMLLCLTMLFSCAAVFASSSASGGGASSSAAWSGMTVAAANGKVAIRTSYSDTEDFVQRIVNVFNTNTDPARTNNYPVDFEKSFLIAKDDDIWADSTTTETATTVYASKDGAGDEAPTFTINESYMAANHGHSSGVVVTIENHGLTYADIGSRWIGAGTYGSGASKVDTEEAVWNLLRIDGNKLTFLSDDKGPERGLSYTFWNGVAGSTLVREDDDSQTLTFPSTISNNQQLKPSIRNSQVSAYAISRGVILDLEDGMQFDCDEFVIEESYEVIDPSTIADAIRENAPEGGYKTNPDLTAGGDVMLYYNITYTFRKDGTMLQEIDHEVVKNMRIGHSPMVMHKMRENFTGGDIYRYIPNTTAFEARDINQASGETMEYDFSTPHKIYSADGETITYPYGIQLPRTECIDQEYPTERYIEYYTDESGAFAATYAEGLLPVGYASKENWKDADSNVFYFYNSLKSYPCTYTKYAQEAGSRIQAASYKKYVPAPEGDDGNTRSYTIAYGDTLYTYVDMFATGETFTLPENCEIFNQSANVSVSGGVATAAFASGDTHAYIVVTSPYDDGIAGLSKEEALAMVAFEKICTEPMTMITKDISLPSTSEDGDVTIKWATSDSNVITAEGKVTRDLIEEKDVTLTATVTDSEGSTPVRYSLTVLPQLYNVYRTQNFCFPNDDTAAPALSGSFVNTSVTAGKSLATDDDGNYYAAFDFGESGIGSGQTVSASLWDAETKYTTVYYYAKIKTSGASTNGIDLRTTIREKNSNADLGASGRITIARIKNNAVCINTSGTSAGSLSTTDFTPVIFKVDIKTSTGAIKVGNGDWVAINPFPLTYNDKNVASGYTYPTDGTEHYLGNLGFYRAGSNTPENVLMISEAAAYVEIDLTEKLNELSDEEKVNFFAGLITPESITTQSVDEVTADLTLNDSYKDYDLEALGVNISWKSSDTRFVADDGTVTASEAPIVPVTMTATVSAGDARVSVPVSLTVVPDDSKALDLWLYNQTFEDKTAGDASSDYTKASSKAPAESYSVAYVQENDNTYLQLDNTSKEAVYATGQKVLNNTKLTYRYYISCDLNYERKEKTDPEKNIGARGTFYIMGASGAVQIAITVDPYNEKLILSRLGASGTEESFYYDMPESVKEGEWFNITFDYNAIARCYYVYANGVLLNETPIEVYHIVRYYRTSEIAHDIRQVQLYCSQEGTICMDNFVVRQSTNTDEDRANAALDAAIVMYASEFNSPFTSQSALVTAGPSDDGIGAHDSDGMILATNRWYYDFTGSGKLTYKVDGADATSIDASSIGTKALTITATVGEGEAAATVSRTLNIKVAPVRIDSISVDSATSAPVIKLSGDYAGKSILVGVYEDSKLVGIKSVTADTAEVTADIAVADGQSVRAFIMDGNVAPTAYAAK